jgi:ADP-ribose pyrophosphatase
MALVRFYDKKEDSLLNFAVIVSRYDRQWVFCKHRERSTYEVPGGHREPGESIRAAAVRELYEETGAVRFRISPVCVYSVASERFPDDETFGMLYFADIQAFQELPEFEMERVVLFSDLPGNLTYPQIQPELYQKVKYILENQEDAS